MPTPASLIRSLILALAVIAATPRAMAAAPPAGERDERWYVLVLQGSRVGYMRESAETARDGQLTTAAEFRISLGRGDARVVITLESEFVETADHQPVSMTSTQRMGLGAVSKRYEFRDGVVVLTEEQGERRTQRRLEPPGEQWLTPGAMAKAFEQHLEAGDSEFSLTGVDAAYGLTPLETRYRVEGPTTVEAMGKVVPALQITSTLETGPGGAPVQSTEHRNERGEPIRMEMHMGAMSMLVLASEKELALAEVEPVELVASTLVTPNRPIDEPRNVSRGVYILSTADAGEPGNVMPALPRTGVQRAVATPAGARVTVDLASPVPADDADAADPRYTGASDMIDPGDPHIERLTGEALQGAGDDPAARAEALRRFVHGYIDEKSLGVGFATASEVCRTRQGDCSEHGVLLAAMLRAAGIPARIASGLLYVDEFVGKEQVFGYHVWTQALLPVGGAPTWVDLDPTLGPDTPFDATHIALSVSSLAEGEVINSMAATAPLLGTLRIDVESAR